MIRKGKDGVNISFQHYEEDGFVFESFASWCYTNRRWEYCKGTGKKVIGMTKIDIISGFLGAGKTTLIKKLIKDVLHKEKIVLIENEFGEIGIDGGFLHPNMLKLFIHSCITAMPIPDIICSSPDGNILTNTPSGYSAYCLN